MSVTVYWPDVNSDYVNELTSDQAKRYTIAPEQLATTGRVLQSVHLQWHRAAHHPQRVLYRQLWLH
eukprot:3552961-Prymnesium_polylepis.1